MPSESVKVMTRVRPMNASEISKSCKNCIQIESDHQLVLSKPDESDIQKVFTYDFVFGPDTPQEKIYEESSFSLVESVVEGYNGTIFAYGQTGCGKTFTMMGDPEVESMKGIIPRTFTHILKIIDSTIDKNFLVRCSFIEIYNEEIHDLLSSNVKARYELKESPDKGVFIKDLSMIIVKSYNDMDKYMTIGNKNRTTGETLMNKDSSRSHSIFSLYVEASQKDEKGDDKYTAGKLNLVDLAGSERQSKTQAKDQRLKEAQKINLSLSALGNVISALVDGKSSHVPYRDSKLTRLLQDSLGGNTKTVMIAAVSPADFNYEESIGTLRYASRAQNIQNKPRINEDPKDALLKEYSNEIKRLRNLLAEHKIDGFTLNDNTIHGGASVGVSNKESKEIVRKNTTKENASKNKKNNEFDENSFELQKNLSQDPKIKTKTNQQSEKFPDTKKQAKSESKSKIESTSEIDFPTNSDKKKITFQNLPSDLSFNDLPQIQPITKTVKKTVILSDGTTKQLDVPLNFIKKKIIKTKKLPSGKTEEYEEEIETESEPITKKKIKKTRKLPDGNFEEFESEIDVIKKKIIEKKKMPDGKFENIELEVEIEIPPIIPEKKTVKKRRQKKNGVIYEYETEIDSEGFNSTEGVVKRIQKEGQEITLITKKETIKKKKEVNPGVFQDEFEEIDVEIEVDPKTLPKTKKIINKRVTFDGKVEELEYEILDEPMKLKKYKNKKNSNGSIEQIEFEEEILPPKTKKILKKKMLSNGKTEDYESEEIIEVQKSKPQKKIVTKSIEIDPATQNIQDELFNNKPKTSKIIKKRVSQTTGKLEDYEVEVFEDFPEKPKNRKKKKKKRVLEDGTLQEYEAEIELKRKIKEKTRILPTGETENYEEEVFEEEEVEPENVEPPKIKKVKKIKKKEDGSTIEYEALIEITKEKVKKQKKNENGKIEEYEEEIFKENEIEINFQNQPKLKRKKVKKTRQNASGKLEEYEATIEIYKQKVPKKRVLSSGKIEEYEEEREIEVEINPEKLPKPISTKKQKKKRILEDGSTQEYEIEIETIKKKVPKKRILPSGKTQDYEEEVLVEVEIIPDEKTLSYIPRKKIQTIKKQRLNQEGLLEDYDAQIETTKQNVTKTRILPNGVTQEYMEEIEIEEEVPQKRKRKKKVMKKNNNGKMEEVEEEEEINEELPKKIRKIHKKIRLPDGTIEEKDIEDDLEETTNEPKEKKTKKIKTKRVLPNGRVLEFETEVNENDFEESSDSMFDFPSLTRPKPKSINDYKIKNIINKRSNNEDDEEIGEELQIVDELEKNSKIMQNKSKTVINKKKQNAVNYQKKRSNRFDNNNSDDDPKEGQDVILIEQVISKKIANDKKLLKKTSQDFNNLQQELKNKEEQIQNEKLQREKLEKMLQELEQNKLIGGKGKQDKSNVEYKEMKEKIKKKNLSAEKKKRERLEEDEKLLKDRKYKDLNEEVEELRKINKNLRSKYKNTANDLKDLERDHEIDKEEMLDTIRDQERDLKLFYGMLKIMIKPEEIKKVKLNSVWDDNSNDYYIPPFTFQEGIIKFPKLAAGQVLDMIENEKATRELVFSNDPTKNVKGYKGNSIAPLNMNYNNNLEKHFNNNSVVSDSDKKKFFNESINMPFLENTKKEASTMPILKPQLYKMPSQKKLDRKNSIEKLALKYNMYNPQSKDIMQSNVHKMLLDTTINSNNESRVENSSALLRETMRKNISKVQLNPLQKQVDMTVLENKKTVPVRGKKLLDPITQSPSPTLKKK